MFPIRLKPKNDRTHVPITATQNRHAFPAPRGVKRTVVNHVIRAATYEGDRAFHPIEDTDWIVRVDDEEDDPIAKDKYIRAAYDVPSQEYLDAMYRAYEQALLLPDLIKSDSWGEQKINAIKSIANNIVARLDRVEAELEHARLVKTIGEIPPFWRDAIRDAHKAGVLDRAIEELIEDDDD